MFKQIEAEQLSSIESEAERMHGPLYQISFAPGTDWISPIIRRLQQDRACSPIPKSKANKSPHPPDANICRPNDMDRSPEHRCRFALKPPTMPKLGFADAKLTGDLDEQFVNKCQPSRKAPLRQAGSRRLKSTAKDADKTPVVDKTKKPVPEEETDQKQPSSRRPPRRGCW